MQLITVRDPGGGFICTDCVRWKVGWNCWAYLSCSLLDCFNVVGWINPSERRRLSVCKRPGSQRVERMKKSKNICTRVIWLKLIWHCHMVGKHAKKSQKCALVLFPEGGNRETWEFTLPLFSQTGRHSLTFNFQWIIKWKIPYPFPCISRSDVDPDWECSWYFYWSAAPGKLGGNLK